MTATRTAIEVDQVCMAFSKGTLALDNVSLSIRENEFFTLLGPSGCGKTTLLRLIAGFEQPTAGDIRLHGQSLVGTLPFKRPINTVFQSYALFPHLTVAQNVAFGLEMQRQSTAAIQQTVAEMLALVKLEGMASRKPAQLSGGQQQRVALARALANRPKVLLLDESLSALDLKLRKEMQVELKRLQRETGITFLFVTHDQEEALTMSDRIAVMSGGKVQQVGSPTEIYDHPANRFVARFIGEINLLPATVAPGGYQLAEAVLLPVSTAIPVGQAVTLAVRPERMRVHAAGDGVAATVQEVVYLGTDTLYQLALAGGQPCQVRMQNDRGALQHWQRGDRVSLALGPAAVQVLED